MLDCLLRYAIEGETMEVKGVGFYTMYLNCLCNLENSVANITANISYVRYINLSYLRIIDEVSMCPLQVLKIIYYCGIYAIKTINLNHLEEKQYFCVVIFGKYYQLSHMNDMEL